MAKRKELPDGEDNGELWLVTYADMMTLIACFFIIMTAFAAYDPVGFQRQAEEVSKYFRIGKFKSSDEKGKYIEEEIARHPELPKNTKVSLRDSVLKITFSGSAVFKNQAYELDAETLTTVDNLIDIIKTSNPDARILIEGHADDQLVNGRGRGNWDLSSMRAAEIVKRFEYYGFPPEHLTAVAKGNSIPLVKSKDSEGNTIEDLARVNRRAMIIVLEPTEKERVKLGLGVYFQDAKE